METDVGRPLAGLTVAVTAERRADQQIGLLERRGATVRWAPVLRSIDVSEDEGLRQLSVRLVDEPPEVLVLQTGQGTTWWLDAADAHGLGEPLRHALRHTTVLVRGPKAASAARRNGLPVTWQAPNEVVSEVVEHLARLGVTGTVAVQLDGSDDRETLEAVEALTGRPCLPIVVYRWELPADRAPALALVGAVIAGEVDAVTFTASPAIRHLAELADSVGLLEPLDAAFAGRVLPVCVGPVCAATARARGWQRVVEPSRPRLVPMVDALVDAVS